MDWSAPSPLCWLGVSWIAARWVMATRWARKRLTGTVMDSRMGVCSKSLIAFYNLFGDERYMGVPVGGCHRPK